MKVLIITRNLPPLIGGMERLNWHLADGLASYSRVHIIGPHVAQSEMPHCERLLGAPLKPLWLFMLLSLIRSVFHAILFKPDVVIAGSGLTAPLVLIASRISGAKSIAYIHGLDLTVKSRIYQTAWIPLIKKMDRIIVNSTPTSSIVKDKGYPKDRIFLVHPGTQIPAEFKTDAELLQFKQKYELQDACILLSVGRLVERKGLREFVSLILPAIVKAVPQAKLAIIGEEPLNSLATTIQSIESIHEAAQNAGMENNVIFLGRVDENTLVTAYQAASVHVFPVKESKTDPEGFGMVAVEAAANGLPTVAFEVGGIIDAVKHNVSGYMVKANEFTNFATATIEAIENQKQLRASTIAFSKEFSWEKFAKKIKHTLTFSD